MNTFKQLALAGACSLALGGAPAALAQTTDGYHSIQVFPVVVDSGSFTQRVTFRNPDAGATITIVPTYVPGDGTSQAGMLGCPGFTVGPASSRTFQSLREICPSLADGSQFGYLYVREDNAGSQPFAAFSRVSNPAGQGFTVEGFAANTFTSANQSISGLRRIAASGGAPAYQTNCFIGNLHDVTPEVPAETTRINYTIFAADGSTIVSNFIDLPPGRLVRMLDVFSVAGAPDGNYDGARIKFVEAGQFNEPALISFCTVQDNTSYGADFRIGKQERSDATEFGSWAAQDDHINRHTTVRRDMRLPGETEGRAFVIPAGGLSSNTHVFYFRHPDEAGCDIADAVTHETVPASYGLELRLIGPDGSTVIAGGDGMVAFHDVYLGDKTERNSGANGRYTLEVEADTVSASDRPYALHCHSGSGQSLSDMIRTGGPDRF